MKTLENAISFAAIAHAGQIDKAGFPYILHPLRVMLDLLPYGNVASIAGVLHDVVEDCGISLEQIKREFGEEVADAVDSVSRRKDETYRAFVERSACHPVGRLIKLADIKDNMRPERQTAETYRLGERYAMALEILKAGID